jgi:hypothetical protein
MRLARFRRTLFALAVLPGAALAGPWIPVGDAELRHHVELLADAGVITAPVTTWPMSWAQIAYDLSKVQPDNLDDNALASYYALRAAMDDADDTGLGLNSKISVSGAESAIHGFDSSYREKMETSAGLEWLGSRTAFNLQATVVKDPHDGEELRADGSYLARQWGNWIGSVGMIDRWWGPGWQSSLILSNNARPVPAVSFQRLRAEAPETSWLSWIGPWQLTGFFGQSDDQESVPNHFLLGARLSFKPLQSLEIGLSRTAQWGGDGRPQSLSSFGKLVAGQDNQSDVSSQPGNQLAGADARYHFQWGRTRNAVFTQWIGEDFKNNLPFQLLLQHGIETAFEAGGWQHRLVLEYTDTRADSSFLPKRDGYNVAYEHVIYKSGYRRYGRAIGASTDNDTVMLGLSGYHLPRRDHVIGWTVAWLDLNRDGYDQPPPGGTTLSSGYYSQVPPGLEGVFPPGGAGAGALETVYGQLSYSFPLRGEWKLKLGGEYYGKPVVLSGEGVDSTVYAALSRSF